MSQCSTHANLSCLPPMTSTELADAHSTARRGSADKFTADQRQKTSALLQRIADLGAPHIVQRMKIGIYDKGRPGASRNTPCSAYTTNDMIHIPNNCNSRRGLAIVNVMAHEMGHFAALNLGLYNSYQSAVPNACNISGYSARKARPGRASAASEEFAEIFCFYVLAPDKLKSACPDSYDFLAKNVFNNPGSPKAPVKPETNCGANPGPRMQALLEPVTSPEPVFTHDEEDEYYQVESAPETPAEPFRQVAPNSGLTSQLGGLGSVLGPLMNLVGEAMNGADRAPAQEAPEPAATTERPAGGVPNMGCNDGSC